MRIHSKQSDFYDTVMAMGVDETLHYTREPRNVIIPRVGSWNSPQEYTIPTSVEDKWLNNRPEITFHIIGFCGELFPVAYVSQLTASDQCIYSYEEYILWKETFPSNSSIRRYRGMNSENDEAPFFQQYAEKKIDKPFIENNCPIFVISREKQSRDLVMVCNENLSKYQFYKVKDPFTAYQEIAQYLSNQLVQEKEVDTIADKYLIENHGYDKTSFRHPVKLKDL